jgi:hypothetical protein
MISRDEVINVINVIVIELMNDRDRVDSGVGLHEKFKCKFRPLIETTAELAGIGPDTDKQVHRVALNVLPADDVRGYVLRRILRRAAKHGKALGFTSPFLNQVSTAVIQLMKESYPELEYKRDFISDISEVLLAEEERFNNTLLNGLKRFEELLQKASET